MGRAYVSRKIFVPRAWQTPIIEHATQIEVPRVGVWAGMGLGKTTGALTALEYLYLCGEISGPTLVTAPLRVASSTWPDEAVKWEHLRNLEVTAIVGSPKERERALARAFTHGYANIYTINYENLTWLEDTLNAWRKAWPFELVVPDEATKLKGLRVSVRTSTKGKEWVQGQGSKRAKSLAQYAHRGIRRLIELTGTPAPNGLKDLWGQAWFLDGGARLGHSYEAFTQRWFRPAVGAHGGAGYGIEPLPHAQAQIEAAMRDLCLTLDIRDYVDIAEPIVSTIYVDLPARARRLYDEMEKKMFIEIDGREAEAFSAAAKSMKCLQLANGAVYMNDDDVDSSKMFDEEGAEIGGAKWAEVHDVKLQALDDIIEEAAGMPVMVAYHFKSDLARLQKAFPKGRHLDARPLTIREWNAGEIPILFTHPASAGHGLNLQDGGNILVFFGHNWNLEEFLQIIERIGPTRQMQAGHDRPVFIYHIVARNTIDDVVMLRRESKRKVQDLLLEACKRKGISWYQHG